MRSTWPNPESINKLERSKLALLSVVDASVKSSPMVAKTPKIIVLGTCAPPSNPSMSSLWCCYMTDVVLHIHMSILREFYHHTSSRVRVLSMDSLPFAAYSRTAKLSYFYISFHFCRKWYCAERLSVPLDDQAELKYQLLNKNVFDIVLINSNTGRWTRVGSNGDWDILKRHIFCSFENSDRFLTARKSL